MDEQIIHNVGIVAHVDAGKTTTTEHLLYLSGQLRKIGRVDEGTAFSDWLEVERARGISVRAAALTLPWRDRAVNLIDTPGHVDFAAEVERSLRVLDGAILIISAADGIEAHTETLWHALRASNIPTLVYVNKIDRLGVDLDALWASMKALLTPSIVAVQRVLGLGSEQIEIENLVIGDDRKELLEQLADYDDALLERFLTGEIPPPSDLIDAVHRLVGTSQIVPVLFGASLRGIGVRELLDAVIDYLPAAHGEDDAPLSGLVFKVERQPRSGRATYVRLYAGSLHNRDTVTSDRGIEQKVTQIRKMNGQQQTDSGMMRAGDIAAVYGLTDFRIGDVLGERAGIPAVFELAEPVLQVDVQPGPDGDSVRLAEALQELDDEDPALSFEWIADSQECQVKVLGTIQLEILGELLRQRYGIHPSFGPPAVIYRETPTRAGEGYVAYTMPKPCWAILRFAIRPGARGSGLQYRSLAHPDRLLLRYQREVERRVPEALRQGLWGWEVTDLEVTLVEGEHHIWHTHPLDFVVATPMAIMDGLTQTGTTLLEPMLRFRIAAPEEHGGKIMSDLVQMRAEFDPPMTAGGHFILEGLVPLATSLEYGVSLSKLTRGRGTWSTRFAEYREAPPDLVRVRPRRGVDPRDRAKYILSVRQALKA